jgi:hypothetical protein
MRFRIEVAAMQVGDEGWTNTEQVVFDADRKPFLRADAMLSPFSPRFVQMANWIKVRLAKDGFHGMVHADSAFRVLGKQSFAQIESDAGCLFPIVAFTEVDESEATPESGKFVPPRFHFTDGATPTSMTMDQVAEWEKQWNQALAAHDTDAPRTRITFGPPPTE